MSHSSSNPNFWMYETSGVLRPAVGAYLKGKSMTAKDIGAIRGCGSSRQSSSATAWRHFVDGERVGR